jgi:AraC-like DNA-binding protein
MAGGRPAREAATPSALAPAVLRWAKDQRSIDVVLLADRAGVELPAPAPAPAPQDDDEIAITSTSLASLLNVTAEMAGEPHLGIRLPSELVFRRYDAGALAARVAATPRDVLAAIAKYAALVFPRLEARLVGPNTLDLAIASAPRGLGYHVDSYLIAFTLGHCRRGGTIVVPRAVRFMSARPSGDLGPLLYALGTEEIEFGCETTGVSFDPEVAARALPAFDPMLVAAAEQLASQALAAAPRPNVAFGATVAARIESMLKSSLEVSAELVASSLKMSSRTLQRRLDDEGVRFSLLFDQVRESMAKELLRTAPDASLTDIAFRVGFSDIATFSRAFKKWTGMPPGTYRRMPTTKRDF